MSNTNVGLYEGSERADTCDRDNRLNDDQWCFDHRCVSTTDSVAKLLLSLQISNQLKRPESNAENDLKKSQWLQ